MKIDLQNRPTWYAINVLVTIHPSNLICKSYANMRSQFNWDLDSIDLKDYHFFILIG